MENTNPFKKAAERSKVAPGSKRHADDTQPPVADPQPVVEETPAPKKTDNPIAGMVEQKETGKPCGFYLSPEAQEKLERLAKQNKCSKSKALDALLRSL